jgi:hypothetical protein
MVKYNDQFYRPIWYPFALKNVVSWASSTSTSASWISSACGPWKRRKSWKLQGGKLPPRCFFGQEKLQQTYLHPGSLAPQETMASQESNRKLYNITQWVERNVYSAWNPYHLLGTPRFPESSFALHSAASCPLLRPSVPLPLETAAFQPARPRLGQRAGQAPWLRVHPPFWSRESSRDGLQYMYRCHDLIFTN